MFVATFGLWLTISAAVVVHWWVKERQQKSTDRAVAALLGPEARPDAVLRLAPDRAVDAALDPGLPPELARMVSASLLAGPDSARIVEDASNGPWPKRAAALRILGRAGDPRALDLIERAIASDEEALVRAAVAILGTLSDRRAAEILVDALRREAYVPSRIATALERFPAPMADLLLPLLRSPSVPPRYWAACLLGRETGDPHVATALVPLTKDPDPRVRKAAVQSLAAAASLPEARDAALALLEDPVGYVRANAARALGRLGTPDLPQRLSSMLDDPDRWARWAAAEILGTQSGDAP